MGKPMVSPLAAPPAAWPVTPSSRKMKFSLERKNKTRKVPYGARQKTVAGCHPFLNFLNLYQI